MVERVATGRRKPGAVLSNSTVVRSNPWLGLWNAASKRAGLPVHDLSVRAVLSADLGPGAHLQWPERVLSPRSARQATRRALRLLLLCAVLRARGRRILLTAHNVTGHEGGHPRLERFLWATLTRLVTDVHAMSSAGKPEVVARHPQLMHARWHVIPHGHYAPVMGPVPGRSEARESLGLPDSCTVLTSVGALLPYKGAGDLVRAFRNLPNPSAALMLAGRASEDDRSVLLTAAGDDSRIQLEVGLVEQQDLEQRLAACDLVVLPYLRVLNSGSALLALTAGRPVLVPDTPTFSELSLRVGPGWVHRFSGELTAEHLACAAAGGVPAQPPDLTWCEWPDISRSIARMWGEHA